MLACPRGRRASRQTGQVLDLPCLVAGLAMIYLSSGCKFTTSSSLCRAELPEHPMLECCVPICTKSGCKLDDNHAQFPCTSRAHMRFACLLACLRACPCLRPKNFGPFLDLCVSSLRRGHANLLCIVPILSGVPKDNLTGEALIYIVRFSQRHQEAGAWSSCPFRVVGYSVRASLLVKLLMDACTVRQASVRQYASKPIRSCSLGFMARSASHLGALLPVLALSVISDTHSPGLLAGLEMDTCTVCQASVRESASKPIESCSVSFMASHLCHVSALLLVLTLFVTSDKRSPGLLARL